LHAVDISKHAVEFAERGRYSPVGSQLTGADIFERMNDVEIMEMFDRDEESFTVKSWIREGIKWQVGNAAESETIDSLGPQDIVVANNFLCHMQPVVAERCLRNIAHLVRPNGYLFVSGIDLDIRTKVADELGWHPLQELLEESHEGDPSMRTLWPWHYAGLEPLNKKRGDWKRGYAAAFGALSVERDRRGDERSGDDGAILDKRKQRCADIDRDRTGELLVQGRRGARPDRVGQRARRHRAYLQKHPQCRRGEH
jgi:SAM-dependent methyltransferase